MPSFSRLLSHPLVVTALQSGALFTTQMQKEREEEEKRNQEMRLKAFEEQQRQLDRDQTRQQELADQATQTKFGSLTQNLGPSASLEDVTAARELAAGLGPAGLPYVQMADTKMQVLQKQQEERDTKAASDEKQRLFEKAIADGKSLSPAGQANYYGELAKNYAGTEFEGKANLFSESAKAAKSESDSETKKWEADNESVQKVIEYKATNPQSTIPQRTEWAKGAGLTKAGWDELVKEEESPNKTPVEEGSAAAKGFLKAQAEANAKAQAETRAYGIEPVSVPLDTAAAGELGRTIEGIARSDSLAVARRNAPVLPDTTRPPLPPAPKPEEQAPGFTYTPDAGIQYTPPLSPAARASQIAAGLLPASGAGVQSVPKPAVPRNTAGLAPEDIAVIEQFATRMGLDPDDPEQFNRARAEADRRAAARAAIR